ncbi:MULTISPECIES: hypothetical protein [Burkholderia]|uniref:hypothetical protein n=1 Tax=Burkholderia TaxID=32008 RepID=UPI0011780B70|nr:MULTISPECIES: hypothetical protein [Burkholderia]MBY4726624.1 hypothetical protein [Burkholderia contaminans]MCI3970608.1 hypothetical protein [Burkholderia sp. HI4860]MDN7792544.1 hypothetical protein [Burkholderia contaminans]
MTDKKTDVTMEKLEAHLRALEAGFIALARLYPERDALFAEFDRNISSIAASFSKIGRDDDWKASLFGHRDALKELIDRKP